MLTKLLHPGNSMRLRRLGIKYFLMWYQALNENSPEYVHKMFASLVPGFHNQLITASQTGGGSVFHDGQHPVNAPELMPILPPSSGEKAPEHPGKFYLEALLDHMVHTVVKLEWQDKLAHHHRCFSFLLEQFKIYYLPKICPDFYYGTSLYQPNLELPLLRKMENETEFVFCRVSLIIWVTNYIQVTKREHHHSQPHSNPVQPGAQSQSGHSLTSSHEDENDSAHLSLDSTLSSHTNKTATDEELAQQIVRDVLCSTRNNVNFVHEIFRQAFLLNFSHVMAVRKIIQHYKDVIQGNVVELPPYALEPPEEISKHQADIGDGRVGRLRNDSYLGAIHKENLLIRAGMQNLYQLFMTHAANVFLLEVNPHIPRLLEEQTDACKRILNIYRFMVMNVRMDSNTWEQLLLVLLQITSLVLGETPPRRKILTLGGKLAPAIFQTLIVTWIKANLNVAISRELWDRFLNVLTSLTNWEELIKEWAKTMETLTRVLARHVYNLDLTNLPLDRLNEQKSKRSRRIPTRPENHTSIVSGEVASDSLHQTVSREDTSIPDGNGFSSKRHKTRLSRSHSESSLNIKGRTAAKSKYNKHRRTKSLEQIHAVETEFGDRTRSPSPAPSSGIESSSIKDSPIQLDVLAENQIADQLGENRGVVCGGSIRGWLPDVAVILWKRMLCSLGDINQIADPKLHAQVFDYLIKLTETLMKIKENQGVSLDNLSTPQAPELVPPLTLILPWCYGALCLPESYETGKLNALRLLISVMLNCDSKHRSCLPQFYYFIHTALTSSGKATKDTSIKYLGPRFLSLQLVGSTILLLDIVQACNDILNVSDKGDTAPYTEAVSMLTNLLSLPDDLSSIAVLQPEPNVTVMNSCPNIKEHIVGILLRAGKRESIGRARCIALCGLGIFIYKELTNQTFYPKIVDGIDVLLTSLKVLHTIITGSARDSGEHTDVCADFNPTVISEDSQYCRENSPSKNQPKAVQFHRAVILCAESVLAHLVNHLGHFPMTIGAARLSSLVAEHDDVPNLSSDDLSNVIFSAPNVQLFILSKNVIASLIELPALDVPGGGVTAGLVTADEQVRVLLRDMSGKSSWDASILYKSPELIQAISEEATTLDCNDSFIAESESLSFSIRQNLPQRVMRHRPPNILPEVSNSAPDLDQLDDLLQYLGFTSPECLKSPNIKLNEPAAPLFLEMEQEVIASVINQRNMEMDETRAMQHSISIMGKAARRPEKCGFSSEVPFVQPRSFDTTEQNSFQQCRLLFSQLGLSGWDRRKQIHLLDKNDRLLRELRNLDNQSCRETHKFAVIYVAPGQEDKNSILSNQSGSVAYEEFLASLAWEIELEYHTGFLGGLQKQGSTGLTAPYVATSFMEAIFHVATRMPGDSPEAVLSKTRHLGNDEVHIVWSEHSRDYRRDIIPTEFCDILIVIYPLSNNLNRVTVNYKADVPSFGVLFNEALVENNILAGLVRATAICASRAKRMTYQFYQPYYEERARSLETVVTKHNYRSTFEEFISKIYSPIPMNSPFTPPVGASFNSKSCSEDDSNSNPSSMLAAALLDSHSHKSPRVDQRFRASANDAIRNTVWLHHQPEGQHVESSSLSPRALKKFGTGLKSSKKAYKHEHVDSPPDSPIPIMKRK
ncbi:hypothetical protein ABEB36_015366 [Hypothenemus hampei]|uniref:Rap-GAP domain-containing protein n=1 Tax=Hypothenemus hampei TaxID=57062 RepID=A0ABD1DZZ4_HYPHA